MAQRNNVEAGTIANSFEKLLNYLEERASEIENFREEISEIAEKWRGEEGIIARIRGADQEQLDVIFGQPAPSDVLRVIEQRLQQSYTLAELEDAEYQGFLQGYVKQFSLHVQFELTKDAACYYPGKLVPTLIELEPYLEFQDYYATMQGEENSLAKQLIEEINAFEGFYGRCHCAGTGLIGAVRGAIAQTPRLTNEEFFVEAGTVRADELNSINMAYNWLSQTWLPCDAEHVETKLVRGGNGSRNFSKFQLLEQYKLSLEEGFRRGHITDVQVKVELGRTYGEDALVVTMGMEDYTNKYVPAKIGRYPVDKTRPGNEFGDVMGPSIVDKHSGYEPEKIAFYVHRDLYVRADETTDPVIVEKINWLKSTGFVQEETLSLPVMDNNTGYYVCLSRKEVPWQENESVYSVGNECYTSIELSKKISSTLSEINQRANKDDQSVFVPPKQISYIFNTIALAVNDNSVIQNISSQVKKIWAGLNR
ncbi:MAG: hypothetical protein ACOYK8_00220 [Alphaproteobacteria bacterium]